MNGTPINIVVQRGHGRTTWELDNLGNCLSDPLVTAEGLKLLTNNPWCGSDQLSNILSIGHPCTRVVNLGTTTKLC